MKSAVRYMLGLEGTNGAAKSGFLAKVQESSSLMWCLLKLKSALSRLKTLGSQSGEPRLQQLEQQCVSEVAKTGTDKNSHSQIPRGLTGKSTCRNKLNQPLINTVWQYFYNSYANEGTAEQHTTREFQDWAVSPDL